MKPTPIKALLLAVIAIVPVCANAQTTSDDYFRRGLANATKDPNAAIADLGRAIKLNPKNADAYLLRGSIEFDKGQLDAAAADFNRALQLDPNRGPAYAGRGSVKLRKHDLDGAIADFDRAIKLAPNYAHGYIGRGLAKSSKGDRDGAMADYNQAIRVNPKFAADAYSGRGLVNLVAGQWPDALKDFKRYCQLEKLDQEYPRLYIWVIQSRLGDKQAANKELAAYFKTARRAWPSKIAAYVLGSLTETQLLAAASVATGESTLPERRCEVFYFVGVKRLLSGDKPAAADYFKKCRATTPQRRMVEYDLAKTELKALGQ